MANQATGAQVNVLPLREQEQTVPVGTIPNRLTQPNTTKFKILSLYLDDIKKIYSLFKENCDDVKAYIDSENYRYEIDMEDNIPALEHIEDFYITLNVTGNRKNIDENIRHTDLYPGANLILTSNEAKLTYSYQNDPHLDILNNELTKLLNKRNAKLLNFITDTSVFYTFSLVLFVLAVIFVVMSMLVPPAFGVGIIMAVYVGFAVVVWNMAINRIKNKNYVIILSKKPGKELFEMVKENKDVLVAIGAFLSLIATTLGLVAGILKVLGII